MRRSTLRLAAPVLAAALLLGVAAGPARAYFTASDEANGGLVIKGPDTGMLEKYGNGLKEVTIVNKEDSVPVWVRAKVFAAAELNPTVSGEGWTEIANDWWQYNDYLEPGEKVANPLLVKVEWQEFKKRINTEEDTITTPIAGSTTGTDQGGEDGGTSTVAINKADGTNYNIIVVYEAQPVKFDADGNATSAEWPN